MSHSPMRLLLPVLAVLALAPASPHAAPGDAPTDTLHLVGEFVDPVCIFQHGMQGTAQRTCARVGGRIHQGTAFLDVRARKLYTVIGQTHWDDPDRGLMEVIGDTLAIRARVWRYRGSAALTVTDAWPWRSQPAAVYRAWPWHWEWSVLVGCGLLAVAWTLLMTRVRRHLRVPWRRADAWRAAAFGSALATVVGSLNGPLHDLSDRYLFSAHMVQHLLLAQVAPLLATLGVPAWGWRWVLGPRLVRIPWNALARVPVGFTLYTVVFSIWHLPVLYDLMMREHSFHIVMHLMVMGTALLMWWPVVGGDAVERPLTAPAKMLYLFLLGTPMMAVAALVTFAQRPLYAWYALAPRLWGLSPVDDQRLGGLIMWVPGGLFYWVIMSAVFFRWSARESRPDASPIVLPTPTGGVWRTGSPGQPRGVR